MNVFGFLLDSDLNNEDTTAKKSGIFAEYQIFSKTGIGFCTYYEGNCVLPSFECLVHGVLPSHNLGEKIGLLF